MKPGITIITIGVDDLEKSLRFYRDGLGLPTQGIIGTEFEYGAVAVFDLHAGLKLAIWPRKSISHDSGIPESPASPTEFTLGHNVSSREEVDAVMQQASNAGAKIVKRAQDTRRLLGLGAISTTPPTDEELKEDYVNYLTQKYS
jgi:uncharacterized protein